MSADRQCPSCGGFCKKSGCERANVEPELTPAELRAGIALQLREIERLRAELTKHQESQFHPDWSLLEATREGLAEYQERVKVLEGALTKIVSVMGPEVPECSGCLHEWDTALTTARAALKMKSEITHLHEIIERFCADAEFRSKGFVEQREKT